MIQAIAGILGKCHETTTNMTPTSLYNEGWMTRLLVIASIESKTLIQDIDFDKIQNWYSEGLLSSPFLARTRTDKLAEGYTHADMALGDFTVNSHERGDILIKGTEGIFGIIEAKMGSRLSSGTKNVPDYSQASRNLACIAFNTLSTNHEIFFYVAAPEKKIEEYQIRKNVNLNTMLEQIQKRFVLYKEDNLVYAKKEPILERASQCKCAVISYESWLDRLSSFSSYSSLVEFKNRCYKFNRIA